MEELVCDVAVIGAGPAGLSAAVSAKKTGAKKVVIIERDSHMGGILQQCIHPGFGLSYFNRELTGPEYMQRFIDQTVKLKIEFLSETMALEFRGNNLYCVGKKGMINIMAGAYVLAMGCRERTRANLMIPGMRPAGIYTAGTAQKLLNIYGDMVGKNIVILGSGDIGMIMARRLTLEGGTVKAVVEILPYLAGLTRNLVQCLNDFNIPLMLSHTIIDITGIDRITSVTVAPVDTDCKPIMVKKFDIECDTLLLSVGLIPENELSKTVGIKLSEITRGAEVNQYMQTNVDSIFACGNVLHVNDLVDNVSRESENAGMHAALFAKGKLQEGRVVEVNTGNNVRYVCPKKIVVDKEEDVKLFFRVLSPMKDTEIIAEADGSCIYKHKAVAVNPGEIESILINKNDISRLATPIKVSVREIA